MKGIIFDFNGTMFQDSDLHEAAWIKMIKHYAQGNISEKEILKNIHGRTNDEIISTFIANDLSVEEVIALGTEKESYYRKLCIQNKQRLVLTSGLTEILNKIKKIKIPMTIATATTKENVDFYFEKFQLEQWFDYQQVVYDDGTFPGKPAPDIFIKAADALTVPPDKCLVFEDSYSGIIAASRAGIGVLVAIDNTGKLKEILDESIFPITATISDFYSVELVC
ncbi:HAD family hydrolase [Enterococcus casseliflavus]|uniref:HAD family hydrolase n=1 Tax=Enterococcus casseliflavus TaxID=37734 RepID=UPI000943A5AD